MSRTLQFKRYNNSTLQNITGANGELIIDSTNQTITVHDGVTPGGHLPRGTAPQNYQPNDYVLSHFDSGKYIYNTSNSNNTIYIPQVSPSFPVSNGTNLFIMTKKALGKTLTITPNTGVQLYFPSETTSGSKIISSHGRVQLFLVDSVQNIWYLNGQGIQV
jgi:hypothetical protein